MSFLEDLQKNAHPEYIDLAQADKHQTAAFDYLSDMSSFLSNQPPAYSQNAASMGSGLKTSPSFNWGGFAASVAGGLPGMIASTIGSLTTLGTDIDRNNILRRQVEGTLALNTQQLKFQQDAFDTNWGAARSVGLASPAQFGGAGGGVYYGSSSGPSTSMGMRVGSGSPYAR